MHVKKGGMAYSKTTWLIAALTVMLLTINQVESKKGHHGHARGPDGRYEPGKGPASPPPAPPGGPSGGPPRGPSGGPPGGPSGGPHGGSTDDISEAFGKAKQKIAGQKKKPKNKKPTNFGDIFEKLRAADSGQNAEIASAAERYESTILEVQRIRDVPDDQLKTMLSKDELKKIAHLAGCTDIGAPDCKGVNMKYRTFDGTCNNMHFHRAGAAHTPFRRMEPPRYDNKFNSPRGSNPELLHFGHPLPGAREVSSAVMSCTDGVTDDDTYSSILMQWGQFEDHDIDFTPTVSSTATFGDGLSCGEFCQFEQPCFPIMFPEDDPRNTNAECMGFIRSASTCGPHDQGQGFIQRQQLNTISSFIDASNVYGSSEEEALNLRDLTNEFGLMRTSEANGEQLLPFNPDNEECIQDPDGGEEVPCFIAGDVRSNENLGLITMHTMFLREHNRIATILRELNPNWNGDKIYHETRKIMGAILQHITYNEYLPLVLGDKGMEVIDVYDKYNPWEDASVLNEFSTAAFRYGHSIIQPVVSRLGQDWQTSSYGNLLLHQTFFAPYRLVNEGGPTPVLRGLLGANAKLGLPDEVMNVELTEKLFALIDEVALDLAALNIQRGRDHGLPGYTKYRRICELSAVKNWEDLAKLIPDPILVHKLKKLYGDVRNIDLFVGGMLESKVEGSRTGEVFNCIIARQFKSLRDGDRYWYEHPGVFTPLQLEQLKRATLSRILCENGNLPKIQSNAFMMAERVSCDSLPSIDLQAWQE